MKHQKIVRTERKKEPVIVNEKQVAAAVKAEVTPSPDIPVRTVYYVEVNDMSGSQVQQLIAEINAQATHLKGGQHYIIPVRHGKIGPDVMFEGEFLSVVHKLCEIKDNSIVLKDGAKEVRITRESI